MKICLKFQRYLADRAYPHRNVCKTTAYLKGTSEFQIIYGVFIAFLHSHMRSMRKYGVCEKS
jgi:hypothetical protein